MPACNITRVNAWLNTASYEQVTQKIYTSSLYRYRNYHEAVQRIIPILGPTIEQFGYTTD